MTNVEPRGWHEFLPNEDSEAVDLRIDVDRRLAELTHLERGVLYLYAIGNNQTQIGEIMGYSQRHIGRILKGIANKAADLKDSN